MTARTFSEEARLDEDKPADITPDQARAVRDAAARYCRTHGLDDAALIELEAQMGVRP